ncbi:hypothetical protein PV325_008465 [Microctonus aethiopoides]|nr:hypothetical protein PV325_008465 [Microctonus aethiopoides]
MSASTTPLTVSATGIITYSSLPTTPLAAQQISSMTTSFRSNPIRDSIQIITDLNPSSPFAVKSRVGGLFDIAEHQRQSSHRLYDPLQYSANSNNAAVKRLEDENEPNKMNEDEMSWKNKYLHEIKLRTELQDLIDNKDALISHLKQEIEKLRVYEEEVIELKVERKHLKNEVEMLNEKLKHLVTPEETTLLQQRHETQNMTFQNLIRDLINETKCRDCKGEKGKNE